MRQDVKSPSTGLVPVEAAYNLLALSRNVCEFVDNLQIEPLEAHVSIEVGKAAKNAIEQILNMSVEAWSCR